MYTFLKVTDILFSYIKEVLGAFFGFSSGLLSSIALLLCVVLVINICNKGASKKFFQNNKTFINVTITLLLIACLISSDMNLVKGCVVVISICLFVIINKTISNKKDVKTKTSKKIIENKSSKKESKKKNETI